MSRNNDYFTYWQELAVQIARGEASLSHGDIVAIAESLEFEYMNPIFYPSPDLASRSLKSRKKSALDLSAELWGMTAEKWLITEKQWVEDVRRSRGNSRDDGKDEHDDIITAELLIRIYAVAFLFYCSKVDGLGMTPDDALKTRMQALRSLNVFIENAVCKGYARANTVPVEGMTQHPSYYGCLINRGVSVGAAGLYLPDPETSLPQLITLLHRASIKEEVYLK